MNAPAELLADQSRQSRARFFLGVGRAMGLHCGDDFSLPLFPLPLILEAEGLLRIDAESRYLAKCEDAIRQAAAVWRD